MNTPTISEAGFAISRLKVIKKPSPAEAAIISEATTQFQALLFASLKPVNTEGSADGSMTFMNISKRDLHNEVPTSISFLSAVRIPEIVFNKTGQKQPNVITEIFVASPIPIQRMKKGIKAIGGIENV